MAENLSILNTHFTINLSHHNSIFFYENTCMPYFCAERQTFLLIVRAYLFPLFLWLVWFPLTRIVIIEPVEACQSFKQKSQFAERSLPTISLQCLQKLKLQKNMLTTFFYGNCLKLNYWQLDPQFELGAIF